MFHDDPLIRNADDLEEIGFIKFYDLSVESGAFRDIIRSTMQEGNGRRYRRFGAEVKTAELNTVGL